MKKSALKTLIREVVQEVSADYLDDSSGPFSIKMYNPISEKWYLWGEPHKFPTVKKAKSEIDRLIRVIGPLQFEITTDPHSLSDPRAS